MKSKIILLFLFLSLFFAGLLAEARTKGYKKALEYMHERKPQRKIAKNKKSSGKRSVASHKPAKKKKEPVMALPKKTIRTTSYDGFGP